MDETTLNQTAGSSPNTQFIDGARHGIDAAGRMPFRTAAEKIPVDMAVIVESLSARTLEVEATHRRLSSEGFFDANSDDADQNGARQEIQQAFSAFRDLYIIGEEPQANQAALTDLANVLVSRVEVVPLAELMATAAKMVDESRGDTIYVYVDGAKTTHADWTSDQSLTSDEFMFKLAQDYGSRLSTPKRVIRVSERDEVMAHGDDLKMLADVAYAGSQLADQIGTLSFFSDEGLRVKLYLARATYRALRMIDDAASRVQGLMFLRNIGATIPRLAEVLEDLPDAYNYFWALQLVESFDGKRNSPRDYAAYAQRYFGKEALTVLETKIPDGVSFPSVLAAGFPKYEGYDKYGSVKALVDEWVESR